MNLVCTYSVKTYTRLVHTFLQNVIPFFTNCMGENSDKTYNICFPRGTSSPISTVFVVDTSFQYI